MPTSPGSPSCSPGPTRTSPSTVASPTSCATCPTPGVDVRPLRQITGEAEFNEVFLTDVRVPDAYRLGAEGQGWKVANATLNNERVAIGGNAEREGGMVGVVATTWRENPERRTSELHDRLMRLWVEAEVSRLTGQRLRQKLALGHPGPEGSAMKLTFARLAQQLSGLEVELVGEEGLRYSDWTMVRSDHVDFTGRDAGFRYLRAKGNSIEGGTSEILRNIVAERVLGLPAEPRSRQGHRLEGPAPMNDLNLLYTDVEEDLRASVRGLLADRCDPAAVLATYDGDRSLVAGLWKALAVELGLAGLLVPEDRGGAGASVREAAVVLEELGRSAAPVPFLTSAVVATTVLLGSDSDTDLLGGLAAGDHTAALVVPLSTAPHAPLPGVRRGEDGRLVGTVTSVAGALEADILLVPVAVADGVEVLAVPAIEVQVDPVVSLDMTRQLADVTLDGASGDLVVTAADGEDAVRRALGAGAALLASEQVGVAQWCLTTTVAYLKERRQFGRAVGGFQALKHRLADLFVEVESATAAARYAAATLAEEDPDREVATAVAQAYCGDVAVHAAEEAVQLHAGIGMTWEHPAHLYLKRAKADQIAFGTSGAHRTRLAGLVDLPAAGRLSVHWQQVNAGGPRSRLEPSPDREGRR